MAGSINQTQVQWSAADSISLSTNSVVDSDAVSVNAEDDSGSVQISVDNSGTPASGDVIDIYVKWSNGDVLGDSSDENTLKAALQSAQKRFATRAEKALASGTGTTNSPATLTREGLLSYGEASIIRS